jgi:hypothetical protein
MKKAFVVLAALAVYAPPAFSQACGDEGRYFHLKPPSYSVSKHRKQSVHRYAKALRWYHEHNGDKPLCQGNKPL